jgi:hypothetical protein
MTADTAGRAVPTTWIDTQPAQLIDTAIEQIRSDDPDAWTLFDGDRSPRYALWAYLTVGHADTLPLPAVMDLVDTLRGPAGPAAYQTGMCPGEAALTFTCGGARRSQPWSGYDPLSPPHPVRSAEVDL